MIGSWRRCGRRSRRRGRVAEPPSHEPADLLHGLGPLRAGVLIRAAPVLFRKANGLEVTMPPCVLRVARLRGVDRMQFLDTPQFNRTASTLLANAKRVPRETLPIAERFEPDWLARIDEPLHPPPATREALANARDHRVYFNGGASVGVTIDDDRVAVTFSGTRPFGRTPARFFEPPASRPWNPRSPGRSTGGGSLWRWAARRSGWRSCPARPGWTALRLTPRAGRSPCDFATGSWRRRRRARARPRPSAAC